MLPAPRADLKPNTADFERLPLVKPTGFREYDARWLFPQEINLIGVNAVGLGIATLFARRGVKKRIVVAHDYRWYSASVKQALIVGLMAGGMEVHDIGLAMTPMAYFAQFDLDVEGVAMVTASHNENGWTGIKMGLDRPLTFGPEEMSELKDIVLGGKYTTAEGGRYLFVADLAERYMAALTDRPKLKRRLKVVVATGNGTAGPFATQVLSAVGCEVVPLHTELDYDFPNYNPNTEDMAMLHDVAAKVAETKADVGLAIDGDGDRCGVVDNTGREIFADTVGVMLARDISSLHKNAKFVVDVKSTGLFLTDPVLKANGATTTYWKTGHSYIKRYSHETKALVGFEKSGHFFFNPPLGRGYDDGLIAALAIAHHVAALR
jgi:phosphomannomutase/phosphoglucomutase